MRRERQCILQIDELRANESIENNLHRLATPVHLDAQPDNRGHDSVQHRPEPTPHAPDGATHNRESYVLVGAGPSSDDSDQSSKDGDANNETHRLGHAKTQRQED